MKSKRVVVAGHLCVDITPAIPDNGVIDAEHLLVPGRMINVGSADIHPGGAVANTGLAMRFFGADVTLAGAVGDDDLGDIVTGIMNRQGADSGLIRKAGGSTSYSVVIAAPGVDRIFLHHSGVNDDFRADDLSEEMLEGAALMHFGYPPAMRGMYAEDGDELVRVLRKAADAGAAVSLDLSGVDEHSEAGRVDWQRILNRALPLTDVFVPSIEELCFMIDRERFFSIRSKANGGDFCGALDVERDVRPLARRCLNLGAKIVLIKCGVSGMVLCTAEEDRLSEISPRLALDVPAWSAREIRERCYKPDRICSAAGAGDTGIAAFLTAMLNGYDPAGAVRLAAAAGACCVTAYDALSGLQPFPELEERIAAGWEKY